MFYGNVAYKDTDGLGGWVRVDGGREHVCIGGEVELLANGELENLEDDVVVGGGTMTEGFG